VETARKITVEVPPELLEKAQRASIDRGIPLLTLDRDFYGFAKASGINLVIRWAAD
jgi:post-segregation antitoxin (ccd killing protein)